MNKSETTAEITKAITKVIAAVKGIDKSMTVGTGNNSYKGVPDQEVKKIIGDAMATNGLAIVPISVNPQTRIERWEESGQYGVKQKQQVFSEVTTDYLLLHDSGEWIQLSGYGHGVDSQDKGAGKATTYALKYTLLYTFLVPTGKIDDADTDHSDTKDVPPKKTQKQQPPAPPKEPTPEELEIIDQWKQVINNCTSVEELVKHYTQNKALWNSTPAIYEAFKAKGTQLKK